MVTTVTSREFNRDTGAAKRAARSGPVYITDRGRPSHVLLSFEDFQRLAGQPGLLELLAVPAEEATIDFRPGTSDERARPADLTD
jgi:prevent-host-death family protein